MPSLIDTLASYVPITITRRLAVDPEPLDAPLAEEISAAVLLADISGFTALAERLSQEGRSGAEELSQLLNAYFGQLIDLVTFHGGDIVKFAGDALLAMWRVHPGGEDLTTVTFRAAQCGLLIQSMLHNQEVAEGVRLSLRVAIGAGSVFLAHLGGVHNRWELLMTGAAVQQTSAAQHYAMPGHVVIAPQAWDLVSDRCEGVALDAGFWRVSDIQVPLPFALRDDPRLRQDAEAALRSYLPGVILSRIAAGQSDWLAELRRVAVIFINLPSFTSQAQLQQAQQMMRSLQTIIYHYEGSINKINVDDKGVSLLAAFGLPPLAHEDDPARAVEAALAIVQQLESMGSLCAIGVTTGRAFCGSIGSQTRREYTMIGNVVNLAARLMQVADQLQHQILCDSPTYQAVRAQARIEFEEIPSVRVKGRSEALTVYTPQTTLGSEQLPFRRLRQASKGEIVGRLAERAMLGDELQGLLRGGAGRVIILEGEAGIGKSRLVEEVTSKAQALGLPFLLGAGDAVEHATPYYSWRPILRQLLNLESHQSTDEQREQVLSLLQEYPEIVRLAPLLNVVLPLEIPENDVTRHMAGKVRADNIHVLISWLVDHLPEYDRAKVLILEDAHWLDSASWALTQVVVQRVHPLLLVLATRPLSEPLPAEYRQLTALESTRYIVLDTLPRDDLLALLKRRLGVSSLPLAVASLIGEKSQGNPFYAEELAYALRDAGLIVIENGECRLSSSVGDLRDLDVPDTVQGVIISRIDQLSPSQQLVLKTGSVIGRVFPYTTLHDVYPIEADKVALVEHLHGLARLDITPLERPEPDLAYIFKHIITQEVAYGMMLFAQRRELHQAVAEWYERIYADDLSPYYPFLAHHWRRAEQLDRALVYLERAGEQALATYANEEAIDFYLQALALEEELVDPNAAGAPARVRRRALWELQIGQAYANSLRLDEARPYLEGALRQLGFGIPPSGQIVAGGIVKDLARQMRYRFKAMPPPDADLRQILITSARAYEALTMAYYFNADMLRTLFCSMRALNLAELAGPSPELARGYSSFGAILGFIPLHSLADSYCERAISSVEQLNDLPAQTWVGLAAGVYYAGVGNWTKAKSLFENITELSALIGDISRKHDGMSNMAGVLYLQGQLEQSLQLANVMYEECAANQETHNQIWGTRGQAMVLLMKGGLDAAERCLEEGQALFRSHTKIIDEPLRLDLEALLGQVWLWQGQRDRAFLQAEQTLEQLAKLSPSSYVSLPGYSALCEVFLELLEQAQTTAERRALSQSARRALKVLKQFARVFPIGQARVQLYQGWLSWLEGQQEAARRAWEAAHASAAAMDMMVDAGLALLMLGRSLPGGSAERTGYLARARTLFIIAGAGYYESAAATLLEDADVPR